jgi:heme-degrading monooxygenase HmoA
MIERHVTFNVHPDSTGEFERLFEETYGPTMAKAAGFVKVELLRELDSPTRYQMVTRFVDAVSNDGWRDSEAHHSLQPAMKALYGSYELTIYDVVA